MPASEHCFVACQVYLAVIHSYEVSTDIVATSAKSSPSMSHVTLSLAQGSCSDPKSARSMDVCHAERSEASQRVRGGRPFPGLRVTTRTVEPDVV